MTLHRAFCTPGGHSQAVLPGPSGEPLRVPEGWSLVRASVVHDPMNEYNPLAAWKPGIWFADESSDTAILCCPAHPITQP